MHNDNPTVPSNPGQLTPAEQADHDRSVHDYPDIKFSPTEYVVIDVQRSPWGVIRIWLFALIVFIALGAIMILLHQTAPVELAQWTYVALFLGTIAITLLVGTVGTHVYRNNSFIVTNERVIAHIQLTPFAQRTQNVELEHIEDCSVTQSNPMQHMFNYGSIRLSTVGDEQTYLFTYVDNPQHQFEVINHVVQQVDEGEPTKYRRYRRR